MHIKTINKYSLLTNKILLTRDLQYSSYKLNNGMLHYFIIITIFIYNNERKYFSLFSNNTLLIYIFLLKTV